MIYTPTIVARFWSKVAVSEGDFECWPWQGAVGPNGYGRFRVQGYGVQHAHRVALEIATGRSVIGQFACHHCDNKLCVNPNHLYAGDHESNTRDGVERKRFKGRGNRASGSTNLNAVR